MKKNYILLSEPNLFGNEIKYLNKCISTNWISSSGNFVEKFENLISKYTGSKYAVSFMNGTSALHIALKIIDLKPGDEVIVPTLTFIAPVNSIIYNNLVPVFMDSDNFFNLDANKCINFLKKETYEKKGYTYNKKTHRRIAAILPVHVFGNAVFFDDLFSLCREKNIKIIEDASESLGTKYTFGKFNKKHTGTIGDIGCISFNGNKIVTCGSGGMIITNNLVLAKKARYLSTQAKDDNIYSIHNNIGYNYRMNNIQAAIGVAQLEKINTFLISKSKIHKIYKNKVSKIKGLDIYSTPKYSKNNNWLNILKIDRKYYNKSLDQIINKFLKNRIQVRPIWYLNHKQKMFKKFQSYNITNANKLINSSLCLPSSTNLKINQINKIIKILYA